MIIHKLDYEISMLDGFTTPPTLLSEADLIATMDKNGIGNYFLLIIGTDATIHEHISKVLERKYALKTKDFRFIPSNLGLGLVEAFDNIPLPVSLTKPHLRAQLEKDLSKISVGELSRIQILERYIFEFKSYLNQLCSHFSNFSKLFLKYVHVDPYAPGLSQFNRSVGPPPQKPEAVDIGTSKQVDSLMCFCNLKAISRSVLKDGPNKGRVFYCCSDRSKPCAFFEWKVFSEALEKIRQDSDTKCYCGLIAVDNVVRGGQNAGKKYLSCSKSYKKCNFFTWLDGENEKETVRSKRSRFSKKRH